MTKAPAPRTPYARVVWVLALLLVALWPAAPRGHEIPNDVTIRSFVKPEGNTLRLLVRTPLEAMRDVDYPRGSRPDTIDLSRIEGELRDAAMLWIGDFVKLYENDVQLGAPTLASVRVSLPGDRSFASYEEALAHVTGPPLDPSNEVFWNQGLMDALFEYRIQSDRSEFSINPGLEGLGLRVINVMRFLPPGSPERAFEFPGNPGLVRLDPRWHQAALRFVELGFDHILDGLDHLLFLFCLVIPFRRLGALIGIVTSFTVAHSVTLIASAFGMAPNALWFPPLIETLIALSIVYMAFENIIGVGLNRRWMITFGFGLVHGFGFSFALGETLQFAGSHLLTSLLSFNLGVELGQLLVLLVTVPALELFFRKAVTERLGTILLSALVAHTGWHWMTERFNDLTQFPWPTIDTAFLLLATRWMMLFVAMAAGYWLFFSVLRKPAATSPGEGERPAGA